ncbi:hypothetical protein [Actinoplanes palleronii]|uniref:hypothetical protein n=1 Tax=Actinoplanes palleronii TaxID=113570 RepID=UPI0031DF8B4C
MIKQSATCTTVNRMIILPDRSEVEAADGKTFQVLYPAFIEIHTPGTGTRQPGKPLTSAQLETAECQIPVRTSVL